MTLREAIRRPLTKPALRKLEVLSNYSLISDRVEPVRQWFVLTPFPLGAVATPVTSFAEGLLYLQGLGR